MDAFECDGRWWLPNQEGEAAFGTLKVSPGGNLTLSLIGSLGKPQNVRMGERYPIILGFVDKSPNGKEITLTGSFRIGSTFGSRSFKDVRESYHVERAYFGAHLPQESSFAFNSTKLCVGGLTEWIYKLSGLEEMGGQFGSVGTTVPLAHYTRREPVRARIPGGEIMLGRGLHASLSGSRYEFWEEGQVKVTCDDPIPADEFQGRYGYALRCLMTFVCDRAQTIEKFSVCKQGAADREEILVIGELVHPEKGNAKDTSWHEMLFTFDVINFPDFILKWFHLIEKHRDACNVYFSLLYGPPSFLDMKFQNVANAVLLYYEHRDEKAALRDADISRMRMILGNLPGPDRDWLIDRLGANPQTPLRVALNELLDEHSVEIDPLIAGLRERFVESVVGTLEYLTRRDPGLEPAALDGADLYWLTEKLRFLLKACFMNEAGMPPDMIRNCFARSALFQHIHRAESDRRPSLPLAADLIKSPLSPRTEEDKETILRPTGSSEMETLWQYLENESPRGRTIAIASYFDEALGRLLGDREESLVSKITTAYRKGFLTKNERDDLNEVVKLRNIVAHRVGGPKFHDEEKEIVRVLKTWQIAAKALPQYETMIHTPEDRLLYVAAVIAARLANRSASGSGSVQPLTEPDISDVNSWPPISGSPITS